MQIAYIGIGSNLGDREDYITRAIELLKATPLTIVEKVSSIYETKPVGGPPQPNFLNGVIRIATNLSPRALLRRLLEIEQILGRKRTVKNGPRVKDLDILSYGDLEIDEDDLVIPHPRMNDRDFVLKGLNEIKE